MAYVLCYELMFGEGLRPHGPAERACLAAEEKLRAASEKQMQAAGVSRLADLQSCEIPEPRPRAVRVNLLKLSVTEALKYLRDLKQPALKVRQPDFKFS